MVKEHKLHTAVKSNSLSNVLKVLDKFNKQKLRLSGNKCKIIDFEQRDTFGLTPIHHAARNGSLEILETLLIHGSVFDVFDCHGLRPIGYACAEGHVKVVDYLLRWGSCANRISAIEYLTPLHLSAMYGYVEIVHLLLRYKADPFVINKDNKTPMDLACAYGKYNVINLLFSFTTATSIRNVFNTNQQTNYTCSDYYDTRISPSDQISRCSRLVHPSGAGTPHIDQGMSQRGSSPYRNHPAQSTKRLVRNTSCCTEVDDRSSSALHSNTRYSLRSCTRSYSLRDKDPIESQTSSSSDSCIPPTLDATMGLDTIDDPRQNLREACFAVQARALMSYSSEFHGSKTLSFASGDLITVLRQYHNGVLKGFLTSEGISHTGLLPCTHVVYVSDHRPPVCCERSLEVHMYQDVVTIPRHVAGKERPSRLALQEANRNVESEDVLQEEEGSPIIIPPQMSEIRTISSVDGSRRISEPSSCGCTVPRHADPEPDLPYCLALEHGVLSAVAASTNKRNSIASMDSGRGSATDSKSVVSGCINGAKIPISPLPCCSQNMKNSPYDLANSRYRCHVCSVLPPPVPSPHFDLADQTPQFCVDNPGIVQYMLPRAASFTLQQHQLSFDSLYYPCSTISLNDTQYSSDSSDRGGVDDVMVNWLYSVGLGSYADLLSNIGYDLATLVKATPEDLNACSITNPNDRQLMKTQLNRLSICDGLPESMPSSIHEFLDGLKLLQYEDLLANQNVSKVEQLLGLTWEDLADIGIQKLGHQKKLSLAVERLARLSHNDSDDVNDNVGVCHNRKVDACQSLSYEEMPYPDRSMGHCVRSAPLGSTNRSSGPMSRYEDFSSSSTSSSCSQDDGAIKDEDECAVTHSHAIHDSSSASHFAHDHMGTVRIKQPRTPLLHQCQPID